MKKHSDFEHPTGEQRFRQVDQRISLPPYNTALWVLDRGMPIYSGDNYEWIERQCAPKAEASRQTLIRLRQRFRWSRPMMAAFLGVNRSVLRRWETGERRPSNAARRLIWLLDMLVRQPDKLKTAFDLMAWGKKTELLEIANKSADLSPN